jgi:hypothetical protein
MEHVPGRHSQWMPGARPHHVQGRPAVALPVAPLPSLLDVLRIALRFHAPTVRAIGPPFKGYTRAFSQKMGPGRRMGPMTDWLKFWDDYAKQPRPPNFLTMSAETHEALRGVYRVQELREQVEAEIDTINAIIGNPTTG